MSRLNQVLLENQSPKEKKKKQDVTIPRYSSSGRVLRSELGKRQKILGIVLLCFTGILLFIYIPAIVANLKSEETEIGYTVEVDASAIKLCNDTISKSPNADFDSDGIDNAKEQTEGLNLFSEDSDFDGATDYYELYVSKTDPRTYDTSIVINMQKEMDQADGKSVSSPYKMDNVILWADDYTSKAAGGVVETINGYHFYNFKGYAQFPDEKGRYVYGVKNGTHTLLNHLEAENAWEINGYEDIEIYDSPLKEIVEFNLFSKLVYANANFFTKALAFLLPDKGVITAEKKMDVDVDPDIDQWTTTDIRVPDYSYENGARFEKNTNLLQNLQYVRQMIQADRCVAVSLFDSNDGEYIGVIYGYTQDGDLLIADCSTKEHVGIINITEIGRKILNNEGSFSYSTIFAWNGLGFSSSSGDRISFFAVSEGNEGMVPSSTEQPLEETTTSIPDTTEIPSSSEMEITEQPVSEEPIPEPQVTEQPLTDEPVPIEEPQTESGMMGNETAP